MQIPRILYFTLRRLGFVLLTILGILTIMGIVVGILATSVAYSGAPFYGVGAIVAIVIVVMSVGLASDDVKAENRKQERLSNDIITRLKQ